MLHDIRALTFRPPSSPPQFGQQHRVPPAMPPRPILLSTDFDDTLVHWQNAALGADELALTRNIQTIQAARPHLTVHINTGRGLGSMQEATRRIQSLMARLPLDFLSLNNGQELYVNRRQQRADRWILSLTPADREPGWAFRIQQNTGWHAPSVAQVRNHVLERAGFQPELRPRPAALDGSSGARVFSKTVRGQTLRLEHNPSQPGFLLYALDEQGQPFFGPAQKRMGMSLLAQMQKALASPRSIRRMTQNPQATAVQTNPGFLLHRNGLTAVAGIFTLLPQGIHKGSAIEELLQHHLPHTEAVITAGDQSYNDLEAMAPSHYPGHHEIAPADIPNYPIVSGTDAKLLDSVADNPRHQAVPVGRLDQALRHQIEQAGYPVPLRRH